MKIFSTLFLICCTAVSFCAEPYPVKDYSALLNMPGFNSSLLEMHFKLYAGYVKNTNDLMKTLETVNSGSYEYGALKRRLGWEFDGMRLHELYFENLGGSREADNNSEIYKNLEKSFGSFKNWEEDFLATAKMRGIGWVILYQDENGELLNFWINEHDGGHPVGLKPVLVLDVFEHAYFLDFGKDRAAYLEVFMKNINWEVVEKRLKIA